MHKEVLFIQFLRGKIWVWKQSDESFGRDEATAAEPDLTLTKLCQAAEPTRGVVQSNKGGNMNKE